MSLNNDFLIFLFLKVHTLYVVADSRKIDSEENCPSLTLNLTQTITLNGGQFSFGDIGRTPLLQHNKYCGFLDFSRCTQATLHSYEQPEEMMTRSSKLKIHRENSRRISSYLVIYSTYILFSSSVLFAFFVFFFRFFFFFFF